MSDMQTQYFTCRNRECPGIVEAVKGSRQVCPMCQSKMRAVTERRMKEQNTRNHILGIAPSIIPDIFKVLITADQAARRLHKAAKLTGISTEEMAERFKYAAMKEYPVETGNTRR